MPRGDSTHKLGDGQSSKAQVEHAGTRESKLVRQRKEEEGIINRKLSIPQHLRDRGIAVIRPRGRKLAGLWERKPRLEEAAGESEWRIVIASKPGEDTEKEERGKREAHTENRGKGRGAAGT